MIVKEESSTIIPKNEYKEDLEAEVAFNVARINAGNPFKVKKKYSHIVIPDFKATEKREQMDWELEEIRRCINGYDGMPGRYYFFFNHAYIKHKKRGKIRPTFRAKQLEWAMVKDRISKTSGGGGVVMIKRRQVGMSWDMAVDNIYDCTFNTEFDIGMNSKSETDSRNFFIKHKYVHRNLLPFIRARVSTDRRDAMFFGEWDKKTKKFSGTQSSIISVAPTPAGHAGNQYLKLVMDEAGETEIIPIWANAEDCIMQDGIRVGKPYIFGTVGDTNKVGKDLLEFWKNHTNYDLEQYAFWGYNCLIVDELGNDMIEDSVRWIIYERKKRESGSRYVFNKFVQKYPLNESDAFLDASGGGVGDPILLGKQRLHLFDNPPIKVTGWMKPRVENIVSPPEFYPDPATGQIVIYDRPDPNRTNGYIICCLPEGEKVLTETGLSNIEDVTLDNKLINEKGDEVSIKKLIQYDVLNDPIYTIKSANTFRETSFTHEHPILVSEHNRKRDYTDWRNNRSGVGYHDFDFKYKPASDVKKGDWVKIPNLYRKKSNFDYTTRWDNFGYRVDRHTQNPLNDPDFWWFVGIWLGDGWCERNGYNITVSFNEKETEYIDRFTGVIKRLFDREISFLTRNGSTSCKFCFQQLNTFLTENFGKYAIGKKIPEWVKYIEEDYKKQLITGYLDSDGSVIKTERRGVEYTIEFVSINLGLLEGIQDILFSLGVVSGLSLLRKEGVHFFKINRSPSETKPCYHLRLAHHNTILLAKMLDNRNNLKLERIDIKALPEKRKNPEYLCFIDKSLDYIYFRIREVRTSLYTGTVYNFECETNTFLCHHLTTHNCDPAEDDDVEKTRDTSNVSTAVVSRPYGLEPPKLVAEYCDRPKKLHTYYEHLAMLIRWYGNSPLHIELNKGGWRMLDWFEQHYPHLLALTPASPNSARGGVMLKHGVKMTADRKQQMKGLITAYVENYSTFIPSVRLIDEFGVFGERGKDDDLAVAFGWCLAVMQGDKTVAKNTAESLNMNPTVNYIKQNGVIQLVTGKQPASQARPKSSLFPGL